MITSLGSKSSEGVVSDNKSDLEDSKDMSDKKTVDQNNKTLVRRAAKIGLPTLKMVSNYIPGCQINVTQNSGPFVISPYYQLVLVSRMVQMSALLCGRVALGKNL